MAVTSDDDGGILNGSTGAVKTVGAETVFYSGLSEAQKKVLQARHAPYTGDPSPVVPVTKSKGA